MLTINQWVKLVHSNAKSKGFWDVSQNPGEKIALMHSELSEALEAMRKDDWGHVPEELADTVIRIMDFCGYHEIDLQTAIEDKHEKNLARPRLHGKAF